MWKVTRDNSHVKSFIWFICAILYDNRLMEELTCEISYVNFPKWNSLCWEKSHVRFFVIRIFTFQISHVILSERLSSCEISHVIFLVCSYVCCFPHMKFQMRYSTCTKSHEKSHLSSLFPGLQFQQLVRNLSVTLDQHLYMSEHVGNLAAHASGSSDSCTRCVDRWAINRPTYSFSR